MSTTNMLIGLLVVTPIVVVASGIAYVYYQDPATFALDRVWSYYNLHFFTSKETYSAGFLGTKPAAVTPAAAPAGSAANSEHHS